jgi:hypothetical protein
MDFPRGLPGDTAATAASGRAHPSYFDLKNPRGGS